MGLVDDYLRDGFVVVGDVLELREIEQIYKWINVLVGDFAEELQAQGKLKFLHESEGAAQRIVKLAAESGESQPPWTRAVFSEELFRLITHARISKDPRGKPRGI